VIQGAVKNGAGKIIVVDTNDKKEEWAQKFGGTDFVNPTKLNGQSIQEKLIEMTDGGCDYTFDCTGNVGVMRAALEVSISSSSAQTSSISDEASRHATRVGVNPSSLVLVSIS
jgi:S-(hydroxymethyl)glutathione dehydrogenase/alcohol dehydrogenase